jgi:hypothetical protein
MASKFAPPTKEELGYVDTAKSKFAPPTEEEMQATSGNDSILENAIEGTTGATVGGAVGYGTGKLAQTALQSIPKAITTAASAFGPLTKEQLMSVKEAYLPQVGEEISKWQALSEPGSVAKTVKESYITPMSEIDKAANQARLESLSSLKNTPISQSEYRKIGEDIAYKDTFPIQESKIAKDVAEQSDILHAQTQEKIKKDLEKNKISQLDEFINNKTEEEINKIKTLSMGQLEPDAEEKIRANIRLNIKANPAAAGFEPKPDVVSMMNEYKDLSLKTSNLPSEVSKARSPKLATEDMPSLAGRTFKESGETKLAEVKDILKLFDTENLDVIPGDVAWEDLQKIRAKAYNKEGKVTAETADEFQEGLRKLIKDKNPYASQLMEKSSKGTEQVQKGAERGFYSIDPKKAFGDIDRLKMDEASMKELSKAMTFDLKRAGSDEPVETIKYLKTVLTPEQFKSLDLATIRHAVNQGKDLYKPSGRQIATTVANPSYGATEALVSALGSPKTQVKLATIPESIIQNYPKISALAKGAVKHAPKIGVALGAGLGSLAAFAAEEGLDSETSGANPETIEQVAQVPYLPEESAPYWEEKGVPREEGIQKARLASFKSTSPGFNLPKPTPSPYSSEAQKRYGSDVAKAEREGKLEKNYVEKLTPKDDLQGLMNTLRSFDDRASQEFSNVLQGLADSTDSQKEAVLFTLNQQPAFRQAIKKAKGIV